jgi:hypothetical protein
MAKKVVKKSPISTKQMTVLGLMVVIAAILVSAFYVSAKLITLEVPSAPSQSNAGPKCKYGTDAKGNCASAKKGDIKPASDTTGKKPVAKPKSPATQPAKSPVDNNKRR